MGNPVPWFEIYVGDMPRALRFYEGVLGRKLEKMDYPEGEMWTFGMDDQGYGASGTLVKMEGFAPGVGGTLVYFACEDCAVEESRVAAHGGQVQQSKMSIGPFGFISLVMDTEGNMIGLHSQA